MNPTQQKQEYRTVEYYLKLCVRASVNGHPHYKVSGWKTRGRAWQPWKTAPKRLQSNFDLILFSADTSPLDECKELVIRGEIKTPITRQAVWKRRRKESE